MDDNDTPRETPRSIREARTREHAVITCDVVKAELLNRLRDAETLSGIANDAHMPTFASIAMTRAIDPEFDAAVSVAVSAMADGMLHDAITFTQAQAEGGSEKDLNAAAIYSRTIAALAEKLAPKTHGAMLKHAGADGGALTVIMTDYKNASKDQDTPSSAA
jgi:hypothetical protein